MYCQSEHRVNVRQYYDVFFGVPVVPGASASVTRMRLPPVFVTYTVTALRNRIVHFTFTIRTNSQQHNLAAEFQFVTEGMSGRKPARGRGADRSGRGRGRGGGRGRG